MNIKVGFFIEEHVLDIVSAVAGSYKEFDCKFFVYKKYDDLYTLISSHQSELDTVVLYGQIDYWRAVEHKACQIPMYYISCRGASLFKVFCSILSQKHSIRDMSIDTLSSSDFDTALEETGVVGKCLSFMPADFYRPLEEYLEFHILNYTKKSSKAAITSCGFVHEQLSQRDIPCYLIKPVRVSMRMVFNRIIADWQIRQLADRQVAVQVLDYILFSNTDELSSPQDIYAKEINITQMLLEYTKSVKGSLKSAGNGRFFIFTTKGMLRVITDDFSSIPDYKNLDKQLRACGIGVGSDASTAEINALVAMQHALNHDLGAYFALDENKHLTGPLGSKKSFALNYQSKFLQNLSAKTSISITTLGKLVHFMEQVDYQAISAQDLAAALNILPRSARRILTTLEEDGVVQAVSSENLAIKGRPRTLYKLNEFN